MNPAATGDFSIYRRMPNHLSYHHGRQKKKDLLNVISKDSNL